MKLYLTMKDSIRYFLRKKRKIQIHLKIFFKFSPIYSQSLILEDLKVKRTQSLEIIIFSKDRPLQLYALLESLQKLSTKSIFPHVIFNCSKQEYTKAYSGLFENFSNLIKSSHSDQILGFKSTLINLLESLSSDNILFLVDDIFLKNTIDWDSLLEFNTAKIIPSIRLGKHLDYCYTTNDKQSLPPMIKIDNYNFWYWSEGEHDWNYPLSLDGNIFSRQEFLSLITGLEFKAPNSLEEKLQIHKKSFAKRLGLCFDETIIVNNPINIVQQEISNIHGNTHQDELLKAWEEGKKFNFDKYFKFKNRSCHQELPIEYR